MRLRMIPSSISAHAFITPLGLLFRRARRLGLCIVKCACVFLCLYLSGQILRASGATDRLQTKLNMFLTNEASSEVVKITLASIAGVLILLFFRREFRAQARIFRTIQGYSRSLILVGCGILAKMILMAALSSAMLPPTPQCEQADEFFVIHANRSASENLLWPELLCKCVTGPLLEELFFRGVIMVILLRLVGIWPSLFLSSILFGLIHLMDPGGGVFTVLLNTCGGLVHGIIYLSTGKLRWPILSHCLWNLHVNLFLLEIPRWNMHF